MKKLKIAAIGTEHRHIFGQLKGMLDLDCECVDTSVIEGDNTKALFT